MDSLDIFLKAVDRCISLLVQRESDRSTNFKNVIEPLFKDFEPVADDLFSFVRTASRLVESGSERHALEEPMRRLDELREKFYLSRRKVEGLARVLLESSRDGANRKFALAVIRFLEYSVDPYTAEKRSRPAMVMSHVQFFYERTDDVARKLTLESLKAIEKQAELRWMQVIQVYGQLRMQNAR